MSICFVSTSTGFALRRWINFAETWELPAPESKGPTQYSTNCHCNNREYSFIIGVVTCSVRLFFLCWLVSIVTNGGVMAFVTALTGRFTWTLSSLVIPCGAVEAQTSFGQYLFAVGCRCHLWTFVCFVARVFTIHAPSYTNIKQFFSATWWLIVDRLLLDRITSGPQGQSFGQLYEIPTFPFWNGSYQIAANRGQLV